MITRRGTVVGDCEEMRLRSGHRVGVSGPAQRVPTSAAEARALLMKDGGGAFAQPPAAQRASERRFDASSTPRRHPGEEPSDGDDFAIVGGDPPFGSSVASVCVPPPQRWSQTFVSTNERVEGR